MRYFLSTLNSHPILFFALSLLYISFSAAELPFHIGKFIEWFFLIDLSSNSLRHHWLWLPQPNPLFASHSFHIYSFIDLIFFPSPLLYTLFFTLLSPCLKTELIAEFIISLYQPPNKLWIDYLNWLSIRLSCKFRFSVLLLSNKYSKCKYCKSYLK